MKIGWPGIIIIEGSEEDCIAFYDDIRPWSWKFLVVRGEQQESVAGIDDARKFEQFLEVDDMSVVAQHCRKVGLEALFRTSMKVYESKSESDNHSVEDSAPYGALCHVDHMNDAKSYRKWLRRASREQDCFLLIKQCYPNHDYSKRPIIVVAVVGDKEGVRSLLKRWRTSRVDVDSNGKPCLERMMTVLSEGTYPGLSNADWDKANAEDQINVTMDNLRGQLEALGGPEWQACVEHWY